MLVMSRVLRGHSCFVLAIGCHRGGSPLQREQNEEQEKEIFHGWRSIGIEPSFYNIIWYQNGLLAAALVCTKRTYPKESFVLTRR